MIKDLLSIAAYRERRAVNAAIKERARTISFFKLRIRNHTDWLFSKGYSSDERKVMELYRTDREFYDWVNANYNVRYKSRFGVDEPSLSIKGKKK